MVLASVQKTKARSRGLDCERCFIPQCKINATTADARSHVVANLNLGIARGALFAELSGFWENKKGEKLTES